MTFWAFSTENWSRAENEVSGIMLILKQSLGPFGKKMMEKGVKLLVIGDLSRIDAGLRKGIEEVKEKTKNNTRITVTIALNYGGRDEIRRAVQTFGTDFENHLDTVDIPDPDFIIRTGGEQRLSGFLLWQCEYSELYFPEFLMPRFYAGKVLTTLLKNLKTENGDLGNNLLEARSDTASAATKHNSQKLHNQ